MIYKNNILTLLLYMFLNIASANDNIPSTIKYKLPEGSNLRVEEISNRYITMTNFYGDIRIVAKYVIEFDEYREKKHTLTIYPTSMIANLPQLTDRGNRVEIDNIFIGKSSTAIVAEILEPVRFDQLISGEIKVLSGEAEFLLIGLSAYYECDQLVFSTGISKTLRMIERPSQKTGPKSNGC